MPRFFINVSADSLSNWDDDGTVTDNVQAAVSLAQSKAQDTLASFDGGQANQHAAAVIRDEMDGNVATVSIGACGTPRIVWA